MTLSERLNRAFRGMGLSDSMAREAALGRQSRRELARLNVEAAPARGPAGEETGEPRPRRSREVMARSAVEAVTRSEQARKATTARARTALSEPTSGRGTPGRVIELREIQGRIILPAKRSVREARPTRANVDQVAEAEGRIDAAFREMGMREATLNLRGIDMSDAAIAQRAAAGPLEVRAELLQNASGPTWYVAACPHCSESHQFPRGASTRDPRAYLGRPIELRCGGSVVIKPTTKSAVYATESRRGASPVATAEARIERAFRGGGMNESVARAAARGHG